VAKQKHKARIPVQKRGVEKKEKIIDAAKALFSEKGYYKTNTIEIAGRAGVATGTFYSYFNNKKEVLIEIMRTFYKETSEKVLLNYQVQIHKDPARNYREGMKLVRFMIHTLSSAHSLDPALHKEILALTMLDKDLETINREEERKIVSNMTFLLRNYKKYIRVSDAEAAATVLFRTAEEIIHRVKVFGVDIDGDRLLKEFEDMVSRYLFAPMN
jgi:Transcriptional regulator